MVHPLLTTIPQISCEKTCGYTAAASWTIQSLDVGQWPGRLQSLGLSSLYSLFFSLFLSISPSFSSSSLSDDDYCTSFHFRIKKKTFREKLQEESEEQSRGRVNAIHSATYWQSALLHTSEMISLISNVEGDFELEIFCLSLMIYSSFKKVKRDELYIDYIVGMWKWLLLWWCRKAAASMWKSIHEYCASF